MAVRSRFRLVSHAMSAAPVVRAMTPDAAPPLPPVLADQVDLIRAQFDAREQASAEALLRLVDAAVLNICEYAQAEMPLLNRVMGLRAAAEGLAQTLEDPAAAAAGPAEALARAHAELQALEAALHEAKPSAVAVALGLGW
jgi:hypothetical protein